MNFPIEKSHVSNTQLMLAAKDGGLLGLFRSVFHKSFHGLSATAIRHADRDDFNVGVGALETAKMDAPISAKE